MPDSPVIDRTAIERLRKWGGADLPRTMIDIFLNHTPERLVQMREGVARKDAREAETGAHSLKSSAGNVGATRLQALCQAAEMLAEAGDLDAVGGLLGELEGAYAAARAELEKIMGGMTG